MSSNKPGKKRANPRDEDEAMLDSQVAAADSSDEEDDDDDEEEEESSDDGEEIVEGEEGEEGDEAAAMDGCNAQVEGRLWRAGDTLAEGETLEFDSAAYDMLHRMHTDWPCLTFDVVQDGLGQQRTKFPLTSYAVAGTQAERPEQNKIICMKLSDLVRTKHDDDQDGDEDSDDEGADGPHLEHAEVAHMGTVNRLRLMPGASHVCATWSETGHVHVWDLSVQLASLNSKGGGRQQVAESSQKPLHTFAGHADEGFALGFSSVVQGRLASGDCTGKIHLWQVAPPA
jgi:ribosome assembly protein RRB1